MKAFFLALIFSLSVCGIDVPELKASLNDELGLLKRQDADEIQSALAQLQKSTGIQMAVLVAKSLQGNEIESYGVQVAEKWKLGKKGSDKGLILILAPNERKARIEVGYGLEGALPDAICKRFLRIYGTPYFRQNEYGKGILQVVQAVSNRLQGTPDATPETDSPIGTKGGRSILLLIMVLLWLLFTFLRPFRSHGYYGGGGWGGSGFGGRGGGFGGGGGFSGGGGGFGGGGSSDSW